jgi:hypothetical protein
MSMSQIPGSTASSEHLFNPSFQKNGGISNGTRTADSSNNSKPISSELPASSDPLHDEFLQFVRVSGMENLAKDAGIIQNGVIAEIREYSNAGKFCEYCLIHLLDPNFQSPRKQMTPRAPDFLSPDKRMQTTRIGSPYLTNRISVQTPSTLGTPLSDPLNLRLSSSSIPLPEEPLASTESASRY